MSLVKLRKEFPAYASKFAPNTRIANIENFNLYGMKGKAHFRSNADTLNMFLWVYPSGYSSGAPLTSAEANGYVILLSMLRRDWGLGAVRPSPYNENVEDCVWHSPTGIGYTEYSILKIDVEMSSVQWMSEATQGAVK